MINVRFKNLDKSEIAKETATERIEAMVEKFPDLKKSQFNLMLEMENSPLQAGPDLFTVKVHVKGGRFQNVRLEKSASNLYVALADVVEHMLEKLNRFGDRSRVNKRNEARKQMLLVNE